MVTLRVESFQLESPAWPQIPTSCSDSRLSLHTKTTLPRRLGFLEKPRATQSPASSTTVVTITTRLFHISPASLLQLILSPGRRVEKSGALGGAFEHPLRPLSVTGTKLPTDEDPRATPAISVSTYLTQLAFFARLNHVVSWAFCHLNLLSTDSGRALPPCMVN